MEVGPNGSKVKNTTSSSTLHITSSSLPPLFADPTSSDTDAIIERNNIEFYKTYDVMTGVRIAATLGGFFGLMVILVLYKSKSKTEKAMEDPDFTAAAVAEVEEEDERQLAAVMEASAYQQLNVRKTTRRSLDTSSMPPGWIRTTTRFSSVGGYSSLLEPPTRTSTSSRLPCFIDEDSSPIMDEEDHSSLYDEIYYNNHRYLEVPSRRRASNITCSSSGSSYLERRDSAVVAGLPALPAHKMPSSRSHHRRRQSSPLPEIYDFYYPIDIRVIQPTPGGSPCGSDRALYDHVACESTHLKPRLAPLASISSCNSSTLGGCSGGSGGDIELDLASYISDDSVFDGGDNDDDDDDDDKNNNNNNDTDDEIEQFSTDSDEGAAACYSRRCTRKNDVIVDRCRPLPPPPPPPPPTDIFVDVPMASCGGTIRSTSTTINVSNLAAINNLDDSKIWAQETLF